MFIFSTASTSVYRCRAVPLSDDDKYTLLNKKCMIVYYVVYEYMTAF